MSVIWPGKQQLNRTMKKSLTIIIPSFNMEKYLPRCLGSLIVDNTNLLNGLDIVVVNDGSTDRTSAVAHEWEAKHPGIIRVIDKPNGHYGSCINAALPTAKGAYVRILDADDRFETKAFEKYLQRLEEYCEKPVDLVFSDCVTSDATRRCNYVLCMKQKLPVGRSVVFNGDISQLPMVQMHCIAYRAQMLIDMGYCQTEGVPYTDTEWTTYPLVFVHDFSYIDEVVYHYYIGREGQSISLQAQKNSLCSGLKGLKTAISFNEHYRLDNGRMRIVEDFIKEKITGLYLNPMKLLGKDKALHILDEVDQCLFQMSKYWYNYAETIRYPKRLILGVRFVRRYRLGKVDRLYMAFLKMYGWVSSLRIKFGFWRKLYFGGGKWGRLMPFAE